MILFGFTKEEIFDAVKTESSLFAKDKFTDKGDPLFSKLVFDEQYSDVIPLFRQLFFEAQAEIINIIPDSLLSDSQTTFIDEQAPDDFTFSLSFKPGTAARYNPAYFKVITIKVKEALISYIMYRWLETKMPDYAGIYQNRFNSVLSDIRKNMRRTTAGNIRPFPY
jgi:hypothetical protein